MKKTYILIMSLVLISSCSTTDKNKDFSDIDYKTQGFNKESAFEVPPNLTQIDTPNKYELPKTGAKRASQMDKTNKKSGTNVLPNYNNMQIVNDQGNRWLVIENQDPNILWNKLKDFWMDLGFAFDKEQPEIGILETKWSENRSSIPSDPIRRLIEKVGLGGVYSSGLMDKFNINLEKTKNGTRVSFIHSGQEEVYVGRHKDNTKWQRRPRDKNLETKLLGKFMVYLGGSENNALKEISKNTSSNLARLNGNNLELVGTLDRNRYRLANAIERISFTIKGYDNNQNAFIVTPALPDFEKEETKGWFKKKQKIQGKKEEFLNNRPNYMISISQKGGVSIVNVLDSTGKTFNESKKILEKLYYELN